MIDTARHKLLDGKVQLYRRSNSPHWQCSCSIAGKQMRTSTKEENPRTAYSLRHTYISFRLMEGADIYQVAKNCRTSVEMIEKFYASHIKDMIDASAINTRKPKR